MNFFKQLFTRRDPKVVEQQMQMKMLTDAYVQIVESLSLRVFGQATALVNREFEHISEEKRAPIAVHVKLYCTGEGENERSLAHSTAEDREIARGVANRIMDLPVHGIYMSGDMEAYLNEINALEETPEAIKQLALAFDQVARCLSSISTSIFQTVWINLS